MPFEITNAGDHFFVRMYGVLSTADLVRFADAADAAEDSVQIPLHRIADLTHVDRFEIGFSEMFKLAERRRTRRFSKPVKSALVAREPIQVGFARMFQTLNTNPMIEIRIVTSVKAAKEWLECESIGSDTSTPHGTP